MARVKRKIPAKDIYLYTSPRGVVYDKVLEYAVSHCDRFSLSCPRKERMYADAREILNKFSEFQIAELDADPVFYFKLNKSTVDLLKVVDDLYSWELPRYPEDLSFYLPTGETWLGSVAHERMSWVNGASMIGPFVNEFFHFLYANGVVKYRYEV